MSNAQGCSEHIWFYAQEGWLQHLKSVLVKDEATRDQVSHALVSACRKGAWDSVQLLLADRRCSPQAKSSVALLEACMNGHARVVKVTHFHLKLTNPRCSSKMEGLNL